jgi:hypothetical protein
MYFGSILGGGKEISVSFQRSTATLQPSQLPIQEFTGVTSQGLKRSDSGAHYSPPSSV